MYAIACAVLGFQLRGGPLALHFAQGNDDDVIGQYFAFVEEMSGENHGSTRSFLKHSIPDDATRNRIQSRSDFIHQAHGASTYKHASQLQLALHPTAEVFRERVPLLSEIASLNQLLQGFVIVGAA